MRRRHGRARVVTALAVLAAATAQERRDEVEVSGWEHGCRADLTGTPVLAGGTVRYLDAGGDFVVLDATSGRELQRRRVGGEIAPLAAGGVVVRAGGAEIVFHGPEDAERRAALEEGQRIAGLHALGRRVLVATASTEMGGDGRLVAMSTAGEVSWRARVDGRVPRRLFARGGVLVVLARLEVKTRDLAGDHVLALALATGELLWRHSGAPRALAGVTADHAVVLGHDGRLRGLDLENGAERWARRIGDDPFLDPVAAVAGRGHVAVALGQRLLVLDAAGKQLWTKQPGKAAIALTPRHVLVGTDRSLAVLRLADGDVERRIATEARVEPLGTADGVLVCVAGRRRILGLR